MRVEISLFNARIVGSCGVFLLVMFLCAILLRMGYGRSCVLCEFVPVCLPVVSV